MTAVELQRASHFLEIDLAGDMQIKSPQHFVFDEA